MKVHKIRFTGMVDAGKTTAIGCVSEITPAVTDVINSAPLVAKERTKVGLDLGQFPLDNGDCIRLFGTSGQSRFQFLWDILAKDALGVIILADNSRPDPLADLFIYLDGFANALESLPCVVGVGKLGEHPAPSLDDYVERLAAKSRCSLSSAWMSAGKQM